MATFRTLLVVSRFLLLIGAQLCVTASLHAAEREFAHWDALAPVIAPYDDPFLDMNLSEKMSLRDILQANEAQLSGNATPEMMDLAAGARSRLEAAGLDPEYLLDQRLVVMERRREEATGVTSTFLDRKILIDGFVLPLAWEGERVIEFLLVPWVGACIHTPPPPPNQIIHVDYPQGLELKQRFEAVRLEGTLRHRPTEHTLFLIDGSRPIPVSYGLDTASIAGKPGDIVAASASTIPLLARAQVWINTLFTNGLSALGQEGSARAVFVALLLAFSYGALHTLGPGHGKAVVVSYFIGTGGSLRRGLTMGARIAVFHVLSAVAIVFLFDLAVRQTTGAAPSDYRLIRLASYGLIIGIGLVMLWHAIRFMRSPVDEATSHAHAHHHSGHAHSCAACNAQAAGAPGGWIAAAVGVVPCTGALIVMLFGLANDLIWPAILMVAAISAGMAVAMAGIGILAILGRRWAEQRLAADPRKQHRFATGARLAGALLVLGFGILLFSVTYFHGSPEQALMGERLVDAVSTSVSGG